MEGDTDELGGADKNIVASSRLNPELCARNSHGQFVNRKKTNESAEGHFQDSQDSKLELS